MQHRRICTVGIGVLCAAILSSGVPAKDWPQWGGQDGRNMVSEERGLPESFAPGEKNPKGGGIDLATTKNVKWVAKLGTMTCSTPAVAGGKVFIGTASEGQGVLLCLDEQTGRPLWQLTCPPRDVPKVIDGRKFWFSVFPPTLGICSSPAVDGDRGDRRRKDTIIGTNDGTFVGMSEIIATPVVYNDRVYVAIGRDPEHGRGRGALWCLDAGKGGAAFGAGPCRPERVQRSGVRAGPCRPGRVQGSGFRDQAPGGMGQRRISFGE